MPKQLKRFKITLEFELSINAVDTSIENADFSRYEDPDEARDYFPQHIGRQVALQEALLADPDLLDRLVRCEVSSILSDGGQYYDVILNTKDCSNALEKQLIEQTEEPYKSELREIMDAGLFGENTEDFASSMELKGVRGTVEELQI